MPEFRMIETNGIRLRAVVRGAGPLVVLVHGFPESWYSWRHQLEPLAGAGFTACAIDVRGYGGSDKPHAVDAYAMTEMTADVAGVVAALSPGAPAMIVGHDWGALIAWHTAVLHPEKVRAVAGLSVPYFDLPPAPLDRILKAAYTDRSRFLYLAYFQDEGVAEAEFERDVRGALRRIYFAISADSDGHLGAPDKPAGEPLLKGLRDPDPFPHWLTAADIDYLVGEFESSGFRGPLNRYRNFGRDWGTMAEVQDRRIRQPALFAAGERDPMLTFGTGDADATAARMQAMIPGLRGFHVIPACGHWTQQEAPAETTRILLDWLKAL